MQRWNFRFRLQQGVLALLGAMACATAGARGDDISQRLVLSQPNAPVEIGQCWTSYHYAHDAYGKYLGTDVDGLFKFMNLEKPAATGVRFGLATYDASNRLIQWWYGDAVGTFSYDIWINPQQHPDSNETNTDFTYRIKTLKNVKTVLCFVDEVQYANGKLWTIPGGGPPKRLSRS